jgi:cell division protein FtsB
MKRHPFRLSVLMLPHRARKNITKLLKGRKITVKHLVIFGILFIIIFVYIFGDYGLYRYFLLWREERHLKSELTGLKQEAQRLETEIQLLKRQDPKYMERIAREEFGLVKPGETIYKLTPSKNP